MGRRRLARHPAKHQQFGQRIGAQAVGAMDAHAGAFTHRVQARQRGGGMAVGGDAAHGVVHGGQHGDGRLGRVNAQVLDGQFINLRQALTQPGLAQVAQIHVQHLAVRAADGAAFLFFMPIGPAEAVAWSQLHGLVVRRGAGRAQAVVLPPVAMINALAWSSVNSPLAMSTTTSPCARPSLTTKST